MTTTKCPSSIRSWDSNLQTLEHKSSRITIRPGHPRQFAILALRNDISFFSIKKLKYLERQYQSSLFAAFRWVPQLLLNWVKLLFKVLFYPIWKMDGRLALCRMGKRSLEATTSFYQRASPPDLPTVTEFICQILCLIFLRMAFRNLAAKLRYKVPKS